jgi:hypothetical protein
MKYLIIFLASVASNIFVQAKGHQKEVYRDLSSKAKPHFVQISLDPFSGKGTTPIPIDSDRFIDAGATVILLENGLTGTATYYYGESKGTKDVPIIAQITGSCTIVNEEPVGPLEVVYTSHCTVCISYLDECAVSELRSDLWAGKAKCSHDARGVITATGDILSRYLFDGSPPLGVSLLDSEARLVITGGTHDLQSAIGGTYDMYNDGKWNMIMRVPLNIEAACKLQEYEFN